MTGTFDETDLDMIRRGDMLGPKLGQRVFDALQGTFRTANCCECGRLIDTREEKDGGDKFGAELGDGRWTCSWECHDKTAGEQAQDITHQLADALTKRMTETRHSDRSVAALLGLDKSAVCRARQGKGVRSDTFLALCLWTNLKPALVSSPALSADGAGK
jgi:hypothetical protein